MSSQTQDLKFGATVLENLPDLSRGMKQWWIEHPLELQGVLGNLRNKPESKLETWRTIKLGTGLGNVDDFRRALRDGGFSIGDWVADILGKPAFTAATEETEVDLIKGTVAELGFKQGARRDQIYERAKELGLELCPAEVGPQLRLQYKDQPSNEWLLIGMEPIFDSGGYLSVFSVVRFESGLWLVAGYDYPGRFWDADRQWVFCRPRK